MAMLPNMKIIAGPASAALMGGAETKEGMFAALLSVESELTGEAMTAARATPSTSGEQGESLASGGIAQPNLVRLAEKEKPATEPMLPPTPSQAAAQHTMLAATEPSSAASRDLSIPRTPQQQSAPEAPVIIVDREAAFSSATAQPGAVRPSEIAGQITPEPLLPPVLSSGAAKRAMLVAPRPSVASAGPPITPGPQQPATPAPSTAPAAPALIEGEPMPRRMGKSAPVEHPGSASRSSAPQPEAAQSPAKSWEAPLPTAAVPALHLPAAAQNISSPLPPAPQAPDAPIADYQLDLARDGEWLDQLARDIARTAGREGGLRFRLHPEHLGTLKVELSHGRNGVAIQMTAETEAARLILAEAQPRLVAEARAQGIRIEEAQVDLGGGDRSFSGDRRDPRKTPAPDAPRGESASPDFGRPRQGEAGNSERYA